MSRPDICAFLLIFRSKFKSMKEFDNNEREIRKKEKISNNILGMRVDTINCYSDKESSRAGFYE